MEIGFFLKKFITFFVEPFGMIFSLFIIGFYFLFKKQYKYAKVLLSTAFGLFLLLSYPPFSNFLVENLENKYPKYDYKHDIKYIHVLGSGHNTDKSQPLSSQISGIQRILEGVIIHKQVSGSKLILTGYKGDTNISNAQMNANLAMALGVDEQNIIISDKPKDTKEEAIFTRSLLDEEKFVLVTSATHMPRAIKLFKSLGLNPIPAPTDFNKREIDTYLKLPDGSLRASTIAIHEYIGILWNMIRS
ncbi:MAG: YdcF family protein [Sulfurimonas sp.]|nr:YdcF family protein [Sulfurimonas sp.]